MSVPRFNDQIEPMTLGNMRANGVRSLDVSCWICHHRAQVGHHQCEAWEVARGQKAAITGNLD